MRKGKKEKKKKKEKKRKGEREKRRKRNKGAKEVGEKEKLGRKKGELIKEKKTGSLIKISLLLSPKKILSRFSADSQ